MKKAHFSLGSIFFSALLLQCPPPQPPGGLVVLGLCALLLSCPSRARSCFLPSFTSGLPHFLFLLPQPFPHLYNQFPLLNSLCLKHEKVFSVFLTGPWLMHWSINQPSQASMACQERGNSNTSFHIRIFKFFVLYVCMLYLHPPCTYTFKSTAGPQIICSMSFCYNISEMPQELNPCVYQLACGKVGLVVRDFTAVPRTYPQCQVRLFLREVYLSITPFT